MNPPSCEYAVTLEALCLLHRVAPLLQEFSFSTLVALSEYSHQYLPYSCDKTAHLTPLIMYPQAVIHQTTFQARHD